MKELRDILIGVSGALAFIILGWLIANAILGCGPFEEASQRLFDAGVIVEHPQ